MQGHLNPYRQLIGFYIGLFSSETKKIKSTHYNMLLGVILFMTGSKMSMLMWGLTCLWRRMNFLESALKSWILHWGCLLCCRLGWSLKFWNRILNNSRMVKRKFKQSIYKTVTIETIFHTFFNIPSLLLISITNDDS